VTPQGGVIMRSPNAMRFDGQIDDQGTIKGQTSSATCVQMLIWQKMPAPTTTAFDGTYTGVSKTVEGGWDRTCAKNPHPGPLTIVNGTAAWAGDVEGSVSPQGVLVMLHPFGARFDGQIDGQGTVTGRFITLAGCSYKLVWQKKGK
jgi:hypothetical protein